MHPLPHHTSTLRDLVISLPLAITADHHHHYTCLTHSFPQPVHHRTPDPLAPPLHPAQFQAFRRHLPSPLSMHTPHAPTRACMYMHSTAPHHPPAIPLHNPDTLKKLTTQEASLALPCFILPHLVSNPLPTDLPPYTVICSVTQYIVIDYAVQRFAATGCDSM